MDEWDEDDDWPPRRFDWFGVVAHASAMLSSMSEAVHIFVHDVAVDIRSHANWRQDRADLVRSVNEDINRLG